MKIIIDTNVLISGIFFTGPPYQILQGWRDGRFNLILSKEIFDEYRRVAERLSLQFKSIDIHDILDLIAINAEFFQPIKLSQNICTDPDDEKFISCALSSNSKIIVTGDKHLLKITGYKGIEIITPKAFIKKYL